MAMFYSWMAIVINNGTIEPFLEKKDYMMEQLNEFFVVLLLYHMMCFNGLVIEQKTRTVIGWTMIATMMINIGINFSVISYGSMKKAYFSLRLRYWKRKNFK